MPLQKPKTMTQSLLHAVENCELSFHELQRQTGVKRQSLMKFVRGEQSLRLDMADKLAVFFELELQPVKSKRKGK
jgi:plasmid maintenance system antidote protein VapI